MLAEFIFAGSGMKCADCFYWPPLVFQSSTDGRKYTDIGIDSQEKYSTGRIFFSLML
jgi:hypothetical protein